jgi:hypothetical protein
VTGLEVENLRGQCLTASLFGFNNIKIQFKTPQTILILGGLKTKTNCLIVGVDDPRAFANAVQNKLKCNHP